MFSNDSPAENIVQRNKKETGYLYTKVLNSSGINVQGEMGRMVKRVFVHHNTEKKRGGKKRRKKTLIVPASLLV